jgi:ribosomal protein L12E/L44/L45/RPP1/RPP2
MNKILTALLAGLFAASINVYAADAAAPADAAAKTDAAAPAADASKDKKAEHKKHGKKVDDKKADGTDTKK